MNAHEELQNLKRIRAKIISAIDDATDTATIESYNFNDGNGTQSTKRRSPKELLEMLNEIDKKIAELERKLQGGGIRTFSTNRYR